MECFYCEGIMPKLSEKEPVQHTSLTTPFHYYPSAIPSLTPFITSHWHNEFELNYIRSGSGVFYYNGVKYLPQADDIFIFTPNQTHSMTVPEGKTIHYDTLLFTSKVFGTLGERANHVVIGPLISGSAMIRQPINRDCAGYSVICQCVEAILDAINKNDAPADMLVKSDLLRLFYYLHAYGHIIFCQSKASADEARIRPILQYIDQHYAEDLTVEALAQLIPLSKSYVMACFKQITGISIVTYISQVRIRKACEMLLTTDKQVIQIALECGFNNLSNFNRQFKKHTCCSPMKYRRTYRSDANQDSTTAQK